jgi:putative flippase GtrA
VRRELRALPGDGRLPQIVWFGVVGLVATGVYLAIAISLPRLPAIAVSPTVGALVASIVSVFVSYLGHHKFTFAKIDRHEFYLPRFILSSVVLSSVATAATFLLTKILAVEYRIAAVVIAVAYPCASYTLNLLFVFTDQR